MSGFRVGVFSDELLLLDAVQRLLREDGLAVELTESRIANLLAGVSRCQPDLLLFDFGAQSDLSMVGALRDTAPSCRIILWARNLSTELAWQAIELGVKGILPKTSAPEIITQCVKRVSVDEPWFDHALTTTLLTSRPVRLTPRESQLVALLSRGLKNKEIATALDISEGTVKVYLSRLFEKVGAKDRFELALFGLKNLANVPLGANPTAVGAMQNLRSIVMRRYV